MPVALIPGQLWNRAYFDHGHCRNPACFLCFWLRAESGVSRSSRLSGPDGAVAADLALIDRDGRLRQLSPPMVPSAAAASLPVAAILFLQFTPGATMTLQPLSRGEAGTRLLAQCLNAPHQPQLATACCAAAAAVAYCGEGVCGEAVQAARHILDVIDQRPGGRVS